MLLPLSITWCRVASMRQNIIYIGHDIDDTQYHGSALNKQVSEILEFACRPTLNALLGAYKHLLKQGGNLWTKNTLAGVCVGIYDTK